MPTGSDPRRAPAAGAGPLVPGDAVVVQTAEGPAVGDGDARHPAA